MYIARWTRHASMKIEELKKDDILHRCGKNSVGRCMHRRKLGDCHIHNIVLE